MVSISLTKALQKCLQAAPIHAGQVSTETLSAGRVHRRVEVSPLVGTPHDPGRAKPCGAIAPPVPVDQPKACFVEGQDLQRLLLQVALAADGPPYFASEVFLKAFCSSGSAFSWRGRPVLSFTLRRLRSWPTLSG